MTTPLGNSVDEYTITQTLNAFETTMANVNAAIQAVEAVGSSVPWTGVAANKYRTSLSDWINGVQTVKNGLEQLRSSMTQHLSISSNAEDESAQHAQWYA
ncbi:hypothetical protein ACFFX1_14205 [Dactylosporangium sucinum]|uniref:ESAT-6-like protein n=1 Tax=Dactylosporangium sucinum TaxID=1424081 RepID=A0A917U7N2_9ACTN|nr:MULTISPECIES: hypothetical protein [Dactylosporangium]WVK86715.1 hypothetical protein KZZ52_15515 [Dactylosporangium sp. AC04546]GGM63382.1 hypothetical protein GCM10007977_076200 [Dactylosporangium sucinum]